MSETSDVLCMVVGCWREDAGGASGYLIKDRYVIPILHTSEYKKCFLDFNFASLFTELVLP